MSLAEHVRCPYRCGATLADDSSMHGPGCPYFLGATPALNSYIQDNGLPSWDTPTVPVDPNYSTDPQPEPRPEDPEVVCVQDEVCRDLRERNVRQGLVRDIEARKIMGIQKYGTPLQPFNGRDALVDLYQELLDAMQYAMQLLIEGPEDPFVAMVTRQCFECAVLNANTIKLALESR